MRPGGTDRKVIVGDCRMPDGIAIDAEAGHIYWTDMGASLVAPVGLPAIALHPTPSAAVISLSVLPIRGIA